MVERGITLRLGLTLMYTKNLREQLPNILPQFEIRIMLDAPCGDFHWMSQVPLNLDQYIEPTLCRP